MGNFEINLEPPQPSGDVVEIRGGRPGRGVVAIVVCLVIVIVLVVAVGRTREKSDDVAEPTTTVVSSTTSTSGASTTTTTTTVSPVRVYGPMLPEATGVKLVLTQTDGHVVHVDVDSGTVTDLLPTRRLENLYQLVALRHGVIVSGDVGPRLIADGKISGLGANLDGLMGTTDGVHVIGIHYADTGAELVSLVPGGPRDASIALPEQSELVGLLPGAVVLQSHSGGVYQFDVANSESHKIAEGAFVASVGSRVASVTCDDALKCRIGVGPFGGPPDHQVDVVPGLSEGSLYYGGALPALSPTRDLLAYASSAPVGPPSVVVFDLATGATVLSADLFLGDAGAQFVWSADGRWLFWVNNGHLNAWSPDRGGDPIEVFTGTTSAELIAAGF